MTTRPLSPTERTTIVRGRNRAVTDRARLHALLAEALVAHVGVEVNGETVVLPMAYGFDPHGPDDGGTLYLHGSVAARMLRGSRSGRGAERPTPAPDATLCATVTELDGLVAARAAFHHSMNYRSAVIIGRARSVTDETERGRALDLVVDQVIPGRAATLRAHTRKELAATAVIALPLAEASLKVRDGGPVDDEDDVRALAGVWAGHIPLRRVAAPPVSATDSHDDVPDHVRRRTADFR